MSLNKSWLEFIALLCILVSTLNAAAQKEDNSNEQELQQKIENIAEATSEDVDVSSLLDKLNYYAEHPLNINKAHREDLEDLLLLDDLQIEALLNHIKEDGALIALEELQTVEGFDDETINKILPYIKISDAAKTSRLMLGKLFKQGKSALYIRYQKVLEQQKGYSPITDTIDTHRYFGNSEKIYSRYRFSYGNKFSAGITAEKDAGEDFFHGSQPNGFDFYSAHIFYRGSRFLKTLVLGDYYVQYGQGLTLYSGLSFGKSADVINIKKNARGILPYASVDENAFMRGAAAAIGTKNVQLDVFYSNHDIDANLVSSGDTAISDDNITVSSFAEEGYHRDSNELANKHSLNEVLYGSHLQYKKSQFNIGATAYKTTFDKSLVKNLQPYNQFEFQGKENTNTGVDYNYIFRNVNFFGEVGRSENSRLAYLNGALISIDSRVSLSILHRHFDKDYQALLSNAFAENSKSANEDGFYLGVSTRPVRTIALAAYYDQFRFPWLRYQVDAPSTGNEYLAQLTFTPSKKFEAYFRYKQQNKPENIPGDEFLVSRLQDTHQANYRLNVRYKISDAVTLTNRVEFIELEKGSDMPVKGFMIYQDVNYKPMKTRFSFNLRYVLFDTDTYDSRIYAYESDVLYTYSIPSYYYKGQRYYLNVRYKIMRGIEVWFRYAKTVYDNQKTISSGLEEIDGNHKSEIKAQIRFQF
jgi:DNA uptake protein ComE-like DNA-binding protein